MTDKLTIAIAGLGNRGQNFAHILKNRPDVAVTTIADPRDRQRNAVGDMLNVPENHRFHDWRDMTALPCRIADAAIISLQDAIHCEAACTFAERGYQLLLEKPMAPTLNECRRIADAARANGVSLTVCHELRYTPFYRKLRELIDSGVIGDIQNVQAFEAVCYWHQAHSYVRGNWRNEAESSPMLLAKSCHDLDILCFLLNRKCLKISSFGSLNHFRPEHAPNGAAKRCTDCPPDVERQCPYSALKIYLRERAERNLFDWPVDIITDDLTCEGVECALRHGPYGRCVYACDNDVVDHQVVSMEFEGGVDAVFTMSAFTRNGGQREIRVCGTKGEIVGNGDSISLYRFLDDSREDFMVNSKGTGNAGDGHGGGDARLMDAWLESLKTGRWPDGASTGEAALASHRLVFAAEESRRTGKTIIL